MAKSYSYENRDGVKPISWDEFYDICKSLALKVRKTKPDIVIGIARGGLYPAILISQFLQKEFYPIRLTRRFNDKIVRESPTWLVEPPQIVNGKKVLLVDDVADSGETLLIARYKILDMGAKQVVTATAFTHKTCPDKPNYTGLTTDELIINPWDNQIIKKGKFIQNPEYTQAITLQNSKNQ
jgi:hypoxanthine phosphoribosyltransferase